jgi:TonB-linked SusC/RagA family outer membrane protein
MRTKLNGMLTLLLAFVVHVTFAQERFISGTVSDQDGTLPGVSILIKGTTTGTDTDFDGKFSIKAKTGDVLVFSYVGYNNVEKTVGTSNTINVSMAEDANVLDEVVITAFGIKRKPDELTTSNQVVKADELTKAGAQNLATALTGKVSGLNIRQVSSGVNQDFTITLRGFRSFSANNEALIVIDGVPSTSALFFALDPGNIENVNVLKGANGAALYGPRGANGVVIVNTKKGGKASEKGYSVNIKVSSEFESYAYLPQRQTRYGQGWASGGQFQQFVYENGAWGPEFDGSLSPVGLPLEDGTFRFRPYETLGSDNIGEFFKTGITNNYGVTVGGGNLEDGYANFSISHLNREFIIEDDTQKRTNVSLRAGKQFGNLSVEGNVQFVGFRTKNTSATQIYGDLLQTATNIDITQFADGDNSTHWNGYFNSPYWRRENIRAASTSNRFTASVNLGYKINDNIKLRSTTRVYSSTGSGFNYNNGYADPQRNIDLSGFERTLTSSYGSSTSSYLDLYSDVIANFDYELTENLNLNANLGTTVNQVVTTNNGQSGTNLTIPGLYNISNTINTNPATDSRTKRRQQAVFADVTLGYKDFLFVNATARNDWLSVLNGQSFFYPSAGVSFIPTKAFKGLADNDVIDRIKLSYSFVQVGNANAIGSYDTNELFSQASGNFYGTFPFGSTNAFIPSAGISDPNLKPEFTNSHEFGLTAEFLKRRITLDVSGYIGSTTDQISQISTSYASGLTNNTINIGAADTKGIEIDLGVTPVDTENWTVNLNASYAASRMEVTKVSDQSDEVQVAGGTVGIFAQVGEQFPIIKGSDYVRDPNGSVVVDLNGDPLVSEELEILGRSTPDYILGFNGSVRYKDFTLSATADYRTGHSFYSGTKSQLAWSGYLVESTQNGRNEFIFPNSVIETSPGVFTPNTSIPTAGPNDSAFLNYYSGRYSDITKNFVLDASAFKVREISLSYAMPRKYLNGSGISNVSISAIARNPFTVLSSENPGYADPEASNQGGNGVGLSTVGNYPNTRTFGLSVNLIF